MNDDINSVGKTGNRYRISDGIETITYEEPDDTEYKQYLAWIGSIKEMCTKDRQVEPSPEPVYEDHVIEGYEDYADQSYEIAMEEYEWNKQHFELDNGLHVYIKGEEILILSEKLNWLEPQGGMTLEDGEITFLFGARAPYNNSYYISYSATGEQIEAELPVKGTLEHKSIQGILGAGLQYGKDKSNKTIIEHYTNATNVYNKISDMVKKAQKLLETKSGGVTSRDIAKASTEITSMKIEDGKNAVEGGSREPRNELETE